MSSSRFIPREFQKELVLFIRFLIIIHIQVESMQETVVYWCKEYSNKAEKSDPTEQCIKSSKQFTTVRVEMIDWPHSSQNH